MRWLWKDHGKPLEVRIDQGNHEAKRFLLEGEGWEEVSRGHAFTEGPVVNAAGELFFVDVPKSLIHKVNSEGNVSIFARETGRTSGLVIGPDQRLYGCAGGARKPWEVWIRCKVA